MFTTLLSLYKSLLKAGKPHEAEKVAKQYIVLANREYWELRDKLIEKLTEVSK